MYIELKWLHEGKEWSIRTSLSKEIGLNWLGSWKGQEKTECFCVRSEQRGESGLAYSLKKGLMPKPDLCASIPQFLCCFLPRQLKNSSSWCEFPGWVWKGIATSAGAENTPVSSGRLMSLGGFIADIFDFQESGDGIVEHICGALAGVASWCFAACERSTFKLPWSDSQ